MSVSTATGRPGEVAAASTEGPGGAGPATLALARVEGIRLLRSPAVLFVTALLLVLWGSPLFTGSRDRFPELFEEDAHLQFALLPLACAALIAANLAVLRSHRHGTDIFFDVVALPPWRRTLAHLLALLPLAAAVGLLSAGRMGQFALESGAVGHPDPLIVAAGPAVVLLFGVLGVMLGRLVRSTIVTPLALALVAFVWVFGAYAVLPYRLVRLVPTFTGDLLTEPQLPDLLDRHPVAHLGYLAGLIVVLGALALLRAGAPRVATSAVAGVAALLTVASAGVQLAGPPAELTARRASAEQRPAAMQECRPRGIVTYCAFGVYASRIDAWNQVVDGVRRRVPAAASGRPFAVRQRVATGNSISLSWNSAGSQPGVVLDSWRADDQKAGTPEVISVGTQWGAGSDAEFSFAAAVAYRMVTGSVPAKTENLVCGGGGALLVWLAGQATPQTRDGAQDLAKQVYNRYDGFRSTSLGAAVDVGRREADLGYALLNQPADRVAAVVSASWVELTAPKTTVEQAGSIFGVSVAAPLEKVPAGEESTIGDCG